MSRAPGSSELAEAELIEHFRRARRDPDLAVLEGFHALKQALRFGAEIVQFAVTSSKRRTGTGPQAVGGLCVPRRPAKPARLLRCRP